MPRKLPPKEFQFKKGQSGNPQGARLANPEVKKIKKLTQEQIADLGSILLTGKLQDIEQVLSDPNSTPLKLWFASIIRRGIHKGDPGLLNAFLDRVVGKVADKIEAQHHYLIEEFKKIQIMSDDDLIQKTQALIVSLKSEKQQLIMDETEDQG